jgi:hypothetical protein
MESKEFKKIYPYHLLIEGTLGHHINKWFGDKSPQISPIQGEFAYRQALEKAGNSYSKAVLAPGANYGMNQSETDCYNQSLQTAQGGKYTIAPEVLDTLEP